MLPKEAAFFNENPSLPYNYQRNFLQQQIRFGHSFVK